MNAPFSRRLGQGGRALEGLRMRKIDPAFLFELGDRLRKITLLDGNTFLGNAYTVLDHASGAIQQVVDGSVYVHVFRAPCRAAANVLVEHMDKMKTWILETEEWTDTKLERGDLFRLNAFYAKFETLLLAELQSASLYMVNPKGGYDVDYLTEAGHHLFPDDLLQKVPDSLGDLMEATRCIAFELPTAAGFHLHRGHESVLRVYWDNVTGGQPRPKQQNMGVFLRELNRLEAGKLSVRTHLQSIKDFHRNPLMHPEQSLEDVNQAISLLSAIRCSIGYMLEEIKGDEPSMISEMQGDQSEM